jgi:hypothetical protein
MKIKVDIDCSPQEARAFLGLPDVTPLHEAMIEAMRERMAQSMSGADMESMMKNWMAGGMANMDALQKMFWNAASSGKKE